LRADGQPAQCFHVLVLTYLPAVKRQRDSETVRLRTLSWQNVTLLRYYGWRASAIEQTFWNWPCSCSETHTAVSQWRPWRYKRISCSVIVRKSISVNASKLLVQDRPVYNAMITAISDNPDLSINRHPPSHFLLFVVVDAENVLDLRHQRDKT